MSIISCLSPRSQSPPPTSTQISTSPSNALLTQAMGFGILEDHKLDNVPGTGLLSTKSNQIATSDATGLKRGTGRSSHIVLMPQPSDDPNDPLNWPRWRKEACFWTLVFSATLASAIPSFISPAYVQLAKEFDVSVDQVVSSFSASYLGSGIVLLFQNPFAIKYGHRIIYLLTTFLMFISCVWCALSADLASISASRVFQGLSAAPIQSIAAITIGQMYFVHERGTRNSIWGFVQLAGPVVCALANSYVTQNLSWRHGFWFMSIACGLCFIGVVLFVPETTYNRQTPTGLDSKAAMRSVDHRYDALPSSQVPFLSQLKVYNGIFSHESLWRIFLRPFPLLLSPATWLMVMANLVPAVLISLVTLCASTIFTVTYGFNTSQIGLTLIGGLVGSALGMLAAGPLSDWWIVWMSRRNRGVYEPEFRLVFLFNLLVGTLGYVGWAIGNEHHMPWIGAVACLAMLFFSTLVAGATMTPYLIDAHSGNATLNIICLEDCVRNIVLYSSAFFANGIVVSIGVKAMLLVYGACQAVCWLITIPMYVYGKRTRSFIARHPELFNRDLLAPGPAPPSPSRSGTDAKD